MANTNTAKASSGMTLVQIQVRPFQNEVGPSTMDPTIYLKSWTELVPANRYLYSKPRLKSTHDDMERMLTARDEK